MNKYKTARQLCQSMSFCFKNGVRIYPMVYGNNFKITIETDGKPDTGKLLFPLKTKKDSKTGIIIQIGVYDRIWELYEQIAANIINQNKAA